MDCLSEAFINHIIHFMIADSHELAELNNLHHLGKEKQHICMVNIGTGYLLLTLLIVNPTADYLIFDSGQTGSNKHRLEYLKKAYPNTKFEIIYGNVAQSMQQYIHQKRNLHFLDLCYLNHCSAIEDEYQIAARMCQNNAIMIVNNMNMTQTHTLIESHINDGEITKLIDDRLQPTTTQFIGQTHHKDSVDYISKMIYVNLDKRTDRKESICNSFKKTNIDPDKFERYPGVIGNPGYFGCCRSHREALILARDRGYQNVLMLEDDFIFDVTRNELDYFLEYLFVDFNESWDVVMFVYNMIRSEPYKEDKILARAVTATTGAGYLVNGKYLPTLIKNFEDNWTKLCNTNHHWLYVCDRSWSVLQQNDRWFYFKRPLGKCCDGTSDGGYH